ncbi:MAG: pterin-4-alpha-carbinolamine dehydratase [Crocinitomicaceae bacterium]|nr:pterin-4-alpha-carbinolamine dehydratase [Crocinitomicaceae bacterium]|tara:strand:- start:2945 stop:3184 length:240 start_codon:yes stop_codon:yes gene_type:complete
MSWEISKNKLVKSFKFEDFVQALHFINKVGKISEKINHHPKITNVYNVVELELWTHTKNGITKLDHELAEEIDNIKQQD